MPFMSDFHPLFLVGLLVIVLIVFGPGKIPQLGGALGRGLRNFRGSMRGETEDESKPGGDKPA
jgi:sec-independent protein translocase protein TatA